MNLYISVVLLVIAVSYLIYMLYSDVSMEMELDKGGYKDNGTIYPDFSRADLADFIKECEQVAISTDLAMCFVIAIYNTSIFQQEPEAPKLNDNRFSVWGYDDDVEDVMNYVLSEYKLPLVRWHDREVLDLESIEDILVFIEHKLAEKRKSEGVHQILKIDDKKPQS
ncbi:hypothetical protein [Motilimonas eburnea]|uniref:hypothetical protein n=1 Tax=Motilimonas eburnea TaxID=1737488 RepID=UPI001E284C34|nr:hypothetical protein [Motilimonas eburnea]MCE2573069.1 hypothetical protein [Motilimonas eburnea]